MLSILKIIIGLGGFVVYGFVICEWWQWFVVPHGAIALTIYQGVAIRFLLTALSATVLDVNYLIDYKIGPITKALIPLTYEEKLNRIIMVSTLPPLLVWVVGFVIHYNGWFA